MLPAYQNLAVHHLKVGLEMAHPLAAQSLEKFINFSTSFLVVVHFRDSIAIETFSNASN